MNFRGSSDQCEPLFKCEGGDHAKEKSESACARNKIRCFFAGDILRCILAVLKCRIANFYIPGEKKLFNIIYTGIDILIFKL